MFHEIAMQIQYWYILTHLWGWKRWYVPYTRWWRILFSVWLSLWSVAGVQRVTCVSLSWTQIRRARAAVCVRLSKTHPQTHPHTWPGAPLRILGPLDSIFTRALLRGGGGGGGGGVIYYRNRDCVPEPVFFSPSPKSDYTVSAIKIVQFCM